jgi:hypothetical protein
MGRAFVWSSVANTTSSEQLKRPAYGAVNTKRAVVRMDLAPVRMFWPVTARATYPDSLAGVPARRQLSRCETAIRVAGRPVRRVLVTKRDSPAANLAVTVAPRVWKPRARIAPFCAR